MKTGKCILSIFLVVLMLLTAAPLVSVGVLSSGSCGDNLTWTLDGDRTLTISGEGEMWNYDYVDPGKHTVAPWGEYYTTISTLIIGNNVTSIGASSFSNLENLTSVTIGNSVTNIGAYSFSNCSGLESITIPNSVTNIDDGAFRFCYSLSSVMLGNSVKRLGIAAFEQCIKLTNVDIPNSVTNIDGYAFSSCYGLKNVTIPNSVTRIGWEAFCTCYSLEHVTIPDSVTYIGDFAFEYCYGLTSVKISNNITKIPQRLFNQCSNLKSVTIPDKVTEIEGYAFYWCEKLEYVSIPDSVTYIEYYAFENCHILEDVYYKGSEADWGNIYINPENKSLFNAAKHFNSTGPEGEDPQEPVSFGKDGDVKEKTIHFKERKETEKNKKVMVDFSREWFWPGYSSCKPNSEYNHELAKFCSDFSMLGYDDEAGVESYLKDCGFRPLFVNMHAGRDQVNTFIAAKTITIDAETRKTIIFVGTIGSYEDQWYSNFDPWGTKQQTGTNTDTDTHVGFADARDYVYSKLENIMNNPDYGLSRDNTIFLLTGHSRGAAVANLLAARIIDDENQWVKQDSIYAYTFATPNVTTDSHVADSKYNCIFNIVNPEDFVTKVMLKSWGFSRYGQTYTLPSKTNTDRKVYNRYLKKMRDPYYKDFTDGKVYTPYFSGEYATWNITSFFGCLVESVSDFYNKDFHCLPFVHYSPFDFFELTLIKLIVGLEKEDWLQVSGACGTMGEILLDPTGVAQPLYKDLIMYFMDPDAYISCDSDSYKPDINTELIDFKAAHHIQTYCAFMHGLSEDQIIKNDKGYEGTVNCPVDIEIIDKETNEVVGRIVDNVVDEEIRAKENAVVMVVNGDKKVFWLPSDGDYEVKLTGNDTGKMDYTLSEIDSDIGEVGRVNFFDVPLTDGETYTGELPAESFVLTEHTLTTEDGAEIQPDETFDAETATKYTVTVSADENGFADGNATYTSGDYATVNAFPNEGYEFDGWYVNDELVSSDAAYRFRVDADVTLTAKFTLPPHVHEYTTVTTPATCTAPGETTYTCVDGDDAYTEAIPALGHVDEGNDGHCDRCGEQMQGGDHCKFCGKIHNGGFFDKLTGFFHKIFAIFKR